MTTSTPKQSEIKRAWHLIDAKGEVLGRTATKIAELLMGKHKTYYVPNLDCGDYVVVTNITNIEVTGRKDKQKMYYRHSNYPSGLKGISFAEQMQKDPRKVLVAAVKGMLPKNKLQAKRLKRLKIYADNVHPYTEKFENK